MSSCWVIWWRGGSRGCVGLAGFRGGSSRRKSVYKYICTVRMHVVQGSAVLSHKQHLNFGGDRFKPQQTGSALEPSEEDIPDTLVLGFWLPEL